MHALRMAALAVAMVASGSPSLAAVQYVRFCSGYGTGYEYVPGTDTCVNVLTGDTRRMTENGVVSGKADFVSHANEGTALGLSLSGATVDPGKTHGIAVNVGTFEGETALGIGAALQLGNGFSLSGAYGVGALHGSSGGRISLNYSW